MMRLTPIFDTSAIINLSKRPSADPTLNRLRSSVTKHGWPLSFVTALELFHGLSVGGIAKLDDSVKALVLASRLSRRRVLLSPFPFFERELFGLQDSGHEQSSKNLGRWLGKVVDPNFKREFTLGTVDGMNLKRIESLFALVRQQQGAHVAQFLDRLHPTWRTERQKSGSSVPEAAREEIKRTYPVDKWKRDLPEQLLEAANIERTDKSIEALRCGCDAYFTFTVSILRDSLIGNYGFEENSNDFHDGMQLVYLCRPSFCIVTDDRRLIGRTNKSSQRNRILTTDQFVLESNPQPASTVESN